MTNLTDNKIKINENQRSEDEELFLTAFETFLMARRLKQYQKNYNKLDKNFALMLMELTETIASLTETAVCFDDENDEKDMTNLNDIIPSVENCILQAHRMYFCSACNKNIKATGINEHFLSDSHLKSLKTFAKLIPVPKHGNSTSESKPTNNSSTTPADKKKERVNSLLLKEVGVKENLPKKMREFLMKENITGYANCLVRDGNMLKQTGQHNRICMMLQKQLHHRYPQIRIYPFGSFVNGLGWKGSDLDVFIDTENCFYRKLSKRKMKDAIYQVQRILANIPQIWDSFEPVVHARTPILRAFCVAEGIDCDLSFSNGLSTCNTSLITYMIELQPICKPLITFLKFWVNQLQLGLNSYLLTLMVIFYLQQEKLLPSVEYLQSAVSPVYIDEWNANFAQISLPQLKIPLATDFKRCLLGIFKFYGHDFDFTNYIICILTGTRIPKHLFDHGREQQLPPVFKTFVDYMAKIDVDEADEVEDLFSNHKPMVIQDPFELIHNVSKGVQENKFIKIISYLRATLELLMNAKF